MPRKIKLRGDIIKEKYVNFIGFAYYEHL